MVLKAAHLSILSAQTGRTWRQTNEIQVGFGRDVDRTPGRTVQILRSLGMEKMGNNSAYPCVFDFSWGFPKFT